MWMTKRMAAIRWVSHGDDDSDSEGRVKLARGRRGKGDEARRDIGVLYGCGRGRRRRKRSREEESTGRLDVERGIALEGVAGVYARNGRR